MIKFELIDCKKNIGPAFSAQQTQDIEQLKQSWLSNFDVGPALK